MLVYSGQISVDGYLVDADGSFAWAMPTAEIHAFVNDLSRDIRLHLLGRGMYEVMRYWDGHERGGEHELAAASDDWAELWNDADKIVYSTTLDESALGPRTTLARHFDADAAREAIGDSAASIGGAGLAAHALAAGLVDEIWAIRYPILVGGGTPFLPTGLRQGLTLADERRFENGAVYGRYAVTGLRGGAA